MNKYKLCRVYRHECGEVKPIDTDGNEYGNALYTYDNEPDYAYAIYENLGDNDYEDWEECEYGDTGYMQGDEPLSYCAWNKSGDRFDEWEVECYYGWTRNWENDRDYHRLKPVKGNKNLIKNIYGIEV